ncbi:hypothetical protein PHK61_12765 [Actinomycetospora lutea]|uniref:hypothetical protein n=1 Tax=Actinomycetospora lutea TaxID=663604 RepID=UPI0023657731|nr:hypothetical protein [Actinomycetospora lutea]MDD7939288.1 hypothetical protein [Actinomycetospora lutea]
MEGPHPPTLTEQDGAAQILLRGIDDWVSLAEARFVVHLADGTDVPYRDRDPVTLREATLDAIAILLDNDLARAGALGEEFEPWNLAPDDAMSRLRREWWDPEKDLVPGNICWLENTPAGTEVGLALEAARGT